MIKIWQRIQLEYVYNLCRLRVYLHIVRYYFKFYFLSKKQNRIIRQHLELKVKLERLWHLASYADTKKRKGVEKELKGVDGKMKKEEEGLAKLNDSVANQKKHFFDSMKLLLEKLKKYRAKVDIKNR